jgi:putative transposase
VTIHRRIVGIAGEHGWPEPSYSTVRDIVRQIGTAMLTLAHKGAGAFRDKFEIVHRHRAERPNAIWQADHTQLDILVRDAAGRSSALADDRHRRPFAGDCRLYGVSRRTLRT